MPNLPAVAGTDTVRSRFTVCHRVSGARLLLSGEKIEHGGTLSCSEDRGPLERRPLAEVKEGFILIKC